MSCEGFYSPQVSIRRCGTGAVLAMLRTRWKRAHCEPLRPERSVFAVKKPGFHNHVARVTRAGRMQGGNPCGLSRIGDSRFEIRRAAAERDAGGTNCCTRRPCDYEPARNLYWSAVRGTTDRRPWRTRGESENNLLALIS